MDVSVSNEVRAKQSSSRHENTARETQGKVGVVDSAEAWHLMAYIPGDELADVFLKRYGIVDYDWSIKGASTFVPCQKISAS